MKNEWKAEAERLIDSYVSAIMVMAVQHGEFGFHTYGTPTSTRRAALLAHLDARPVGASEPVSYQYRMTTRAGTKTGWQECSLAFVLEMKDQPDFESRPLFTHPSPSAAPQEEVEAMRARKDAAYEERNKVVAALARLFPSGIARTAIEGWSDDWHGCVYIDLPTGQVSWHFHDSQAHLFDGLPPYTKGWDGHDTPEKYARLALLAAAPPSEDALDAKRPAGFVKPDNDKRVFFYEQDFYVLSNFSAFTLQWKELRFDTSEAAYHWEKFSGDSGAAQLTRHFILTAASAHEAFKIAGDNKQHRRDDWDEVKVPIMRDILRAKVAQHEYVRRKLLATGDRELIEDSWRDDYWGWGPDGNGKNMLGKLWMEVRSELRAEIAKEQQHG